MKPAKLAAARRALLALRAEALGAGPARIEPNRPDPVAATDEDAQALSEMMQTLSSERNKTQAKVLGEVARALRKLDEAPDDYGRCEECEEEIAPRRLEVVPHARLCAECQAKHDPPRGQTRRSITDYR
ncbi:MAG TPA: TraR/DksA C4-type zinc finger protein [Polyangia bacterium]|jgi:DnaK suppressor protein